MGARPMSSSRGLRILVPVRALVSLSGSIWFRFRYVKTQTLHYLCISFVTQEFMY
jgi:hypothetical protein